MIEGQEGVSWAQWRALAQACEQHRVPALFRSDHYSNLQGDPDRGSLDAWGTLCGLAAVTTELRLGTMVSPATFRHPSELAKLVVTADQISGGRISLGLGAGWHLGEHEAHGFPFADTRTRVDVMEEQLQVILGAWGEEAFSFSGRHYRLRALRAQPKPIQRPHPPIILGGSGGPRSAGLAARFADEYNTPSVTLADIPKLRSSIDAACDRIGRAPIPFSIMTAVVAGTDEAELRERLRRLGEKIGAAPDGLRTDPPAGWVIGLVTDVIEQLRAFRDAGVARVMCQQLLHEDLEAVALLGDQLIPELA